MARLLILLPTLIFAGYAIAELNRERLPTAAIYAVGPLRTGIPQRQAGNWMPDLFIYRAGAVLGWRGDSPYDTAKIAAGVREQYPGDDNLAANCGYFLPPQAIVVYGPFAALPWATAKLLYSVLCLASVVLGWYGLTFAFRNRSAPPLEQVPLLLPWLVVLHPVLTMTFDVGQTTILIAGAIIAGQLLQQRNRPILGALFWAFAFVKPHLALPLIPLAWYLNGWRRAALLIAWLAVLNLSGCLLAQVSPLEYLRYLGDSHKLVEFNRVELNPQITSWNRVVVSLGGPALEMTMAATFAGYAVFGLLIVARCGIPRRWPTDAWALAVAAVAALVCCQVLGYESWLLILMVPFILECVERKRLVTAMVVIALLLIQMASLDRMARLGANLDFRFQSDCFSPLFFSFRPWLIGLLALVLLARPGFRVDSPNAP